MKKECLQAGNSSETIEALSDRIEILRLLRQCDLQVSDISPEQTPEFFGIRSGLSLLGIVGLERFGQVGLLRSLAVIPDARGRTLGRRLVEFAERYAATHGVEKLFLLTTTAGDFFRKIGYSPTERADAPSAIRATTQFSSLCPASSEFLSKTFSLTKHSSETTMSQLTPREIELVAIGAAIGSNCIPCVEYHIGAGKQLGISDEEIRAAIALADKVRRAPARKVLEAAKAATEGTTENSESASQCAALSKAANQTT